MRTNLIENIARDCLFDVGQIIAEVIYPDYDGPEVSQLVDTFNKMPPEVRDHVVGIIREHHQLLAQAIARECMDVVNEVGRDKAGCIDNVLIDGLGVDMVQADNNELYPQLKFYLANNPKFGKNEVTAYYPTLEEYEMMRGLEPTKVKMAFEPWRQMVHDRMVERDRVSSEVEFVLESVAVVSEDDKVVKEVEAGDGFVRWM